MKLTKVISGGQTGADRAGLDWAIANGVPHGGWCPKGRKAEDAPIPAQYQLQEAPSADYLQRNQWNVRDSDATVIFTIGSTLGGGSKRTAEFAVQQQKPWIHLHEGLGIDECAARLKAFIEQHQVKVLNVAGSRGSKEPRVGEFVRALLDVLMPSGAIKNSRNLSDELAK